MLAACQSGRTEQPHFTFEFFKIREDATDKDKAFKDCEAGAKRRYRYVSGLYSYGYGYSGAILTCMFHEGWGQSKNPVEFRPIRRVE